MGVVYRGNCKQVKKKYGGFEFFYGKKLLLFCCSLFYYCVGKKNGGGKENKNCKLTSKPPLCFGHLLRKKHRNVI